MAKRGPKCKVDIGTLRSKMAEGYSMADVGREVGVTTERIRQLCVEHGIVHGAELKTKKDAEIAKLLSQGMAAGIVSSAMGVSTSNVLLTAKKFGIKPKSIRRWDDEQLQAFRRMWPDRSIPVSEIAEAMGSTPKLCYNMAAHLKIRRRVDFDAKLMAELYRTMSTSEVAKIVGCTPARVHQLVTKLGIGRSMQQAQLFRFRGVA